MTDATRREFEEWAAARWSRDWLARFRDGYQIPEVDASWTAWQAARSANVGAGERGRERRAVQVLADEAEKLLDGKGSIGRVQDAIAVVRDYLRARHGEGK